MRRGNRDRRVPSASSLEVSVLSLIPVVGSEIPHLRDNFIVLVPPVKRWADPGRSCPTTWTGSGCWRACSTGWLSLPERCTVYYRRSGSASNCTSGCWTRSIASCPCCDSYATGSKGMGIRSPMDGRKGDGRHLRIGECDDFPTARTHYSPMNPDPGFALLVMTYFNAIAV